MMDSGRDYWQAGKTAILLLYQLKPPIQNMHYLIVQGHTLQTKNRLELDALNWIRHDLDRTLFKKEDLPAIKKRINNQLAALNESHTRCKPLELKWWQPSNTAGSDWRMDLPFVTVYFYAQNNG
jgi:hypothetical protein